MKPLDPSPSRLSVNPPCSRLSPVRAWTLALIASTVLVGAPQLDAREPFESKLAVSDTAFDTSKAAGAMRALTDDPFAFDPGFYQGRWHADSFFVPIAGQDLRGRKLVRLDNGDVVVAGLTPAWGQNNPSNGRWNLGLARYNSQGNLVWMSPGDPYYALGHVIYPNVAAPSFHEVKDIQVWGQRLYVLADRYHPDGDRDVVVVTLDRETGEPLGTYGAFTRDDDETGGGMVFHQPQPSTFPLPPAKLYVSGRTLFSASGRRQASLMRFTVNANGSLTRDSNLGASGNQTYVDYTPPSTFCIVQPCQSVATDITLTTQLISGSIHRLYLGGSVFYNAGDWDYLAIAVNSVGVPDTSFGFGGYARVPFDRGGNNRDESVAIAARRVEHIPQSDEVFLAGWVTGTSDTGTGGAAGNRALGVAKLGHSGGQLNSWHVGGCGPTTPLCSLFGRPDREVRAMSLNVNRLAIVGAEHLDPICVNPPCTGARIGDATLTLVDADTGALTEDTYLPLRDSDNTRMNGYAWGVVASGTNTFTITGTGGLPRRFITARVRSDRLFGNGFQQP